MRCKKSDQAGFSLVEVAIVTIIAGILLAAFSNYISQYIAIAKIKTTEARIDQIVEALNSYASVNGALPCVASRVVGINTVIAPTAAANVPRFGRAVRSNDPNDVGCDGAPSGAANGNMISAGVRIGALPNRDLNLPDEFAFDAWGSRFVYAVTEDLTTTNLGNFNDTLGRIRVMNRDGTTSVINPAGQGRFVVLSVGPHREGGYTADGALTLACNTTVGYDNENCNDDRTFSYTMMASNALGPEFFDDTVAYSAVSTGNPVTDCAAKGMIYAPGDPYADADGCTFTTGAIAMRSVTARDSDDTVSFTSLSGPQNVLTYFDNSATTSRTDSNYRWGLKCDGDNGWMLLACSAANNTTAASDVRMIMIDGYATCYSDDEEWQSNSTLTVTCGRNFNERH